MMITWLFAVVVGIVGLALTIVVFVAFIRMGWQAISHIIRHVFGSLANVGRLIGAVVAACILIPLTVVNVLIGRWSAAQHYGRAVQAELGQAGWACFRAVIGHPFRLLLLGDVVDGIERRVPAVMAAAPGADRPSRAASKFPGYRVVGSLQAGGSGAKLYVAVAEGNTAARLEREHGLSEGEQVVIKSFSRNEGASLPQIVRESRSLDAAKQLGLVLDHDLNEERFFYVMRYVPGQPLGEVTRSLHARSSHEGLGDRELTTAMAITAELLRTLGRYHDAGLWHKDVKPDNVIVNEHGAHLVDLGLLTPLRSAMTLTTHGTEYFRDHELVKMAMRGVKVRDVDGVKFDIYGVGAVLYSIVEDSFPAHGGLSAINKRCPEALRWVIRRSMSDLNKRYATTGEMLADLEAVLAAQDPFALKPAQLPSMGGTIVRAQDPASERPSSFVGGHASPASPAPAPRASHWGVGAHAASGERPPARDQLASAQAKLRSARRRVREHRSRAGAHKPGGMAGVVIAVLLLVAGVAIAGAYRFSARTAVVRDGVAAQPMMSNEVRAINAAQWAKNTFDNDLDPPLADHRILAVLLGPRSGGELYGLFVDELRERGYTVLTEDDEAGRQAKAELLVDVSGFFLEEPEQGGFAEIDTWLRADDTPDGVALLLQDEAGQWISYAVGKPREGADQSGWTSPVMLEFPEQGRDSPLRAVLDRP